MIRMARINTEKMEPAIQPFGLAPIREDEKVEAECAYCHCI